MSQESHVTHDRSVALHSGDYVERYNAKPLDRVQALVRRIPLTQETRVVDFGCGNGMLLQAMGDCFGSYDGVDFSRDFIDSANAWAEKTGRKNYRFHHADIQDFCARHRQEFDVATTLDFSEHVDDGRAIDIYSAIRQALCRGGRLYLHTPNLDFFLERAKQAGIVPQFPEHIAVRNSSQLVKLLEESGFETERINVQVIPHYNALKLLHPLSKLPMLGKFFGARLWIEAKA
jgi:2-polyprenyl-6-hydroxyphenyl methylase / 3-demethylubiquinone-9 3-methyltransferase